MIMFSGMFSGCCFPECRASSMFEKQEKKKKATGSSGLSSDSGVISMRADRSRPGVVLQSFRGGGGRNYIGHYYMVYLEVNFIVTPV